MNLKDMKLLLMDKGVIFSDGLNQIEIKKAEKFYNIKFPPDLSEFLQYALPISKGFVNWRDFSDENVNKIKWILNCPLEGMLFDIEKNGFWMEEWGEKPQDIDEAFQICKQQYDKAPILIPIYFHRYIPSEPYEKGNPVYSVHQTDIIYYGENLESYFQIQFGKGRQEEMKHKNIKEIRFWRDIVS
jgi:hypothetical protein